MTITVEERRTTDAGRRAARLVIVADNLTGAADSAAPFAGWTEVVIPLGPEDPWPDGGLIAVDTDTRHADPGTASERVFGVVHRAAAEGSDVYKKIDSLGRGNIGVEVRAAADALRVDGVPPIVLVAPAFPTAGRTTLGGVLHVQGEPLYTDGRVVRFADLLAGHRFRVVELPRPAGTDDVVRGLEAAARSGHNLVIIDAETEEHLASIARGVQAFGRPVLMVGTGGLSRHLVGLLGPRPDRARSAKQAELPTLRGPALFVVGSPSPVAKAQLTELLAAGVHGVPLRPRSRPRAARVLRDQLARGADVAIFPDPTLPVLVAQSAGVVDDLTRSAAEVLRGVGTLVVTGGETARILLTRSGVGHLHVAGEIEPGLVVSYPDGHRPIVITKSGAFGDLDTLARCIPPRWAAAS